MKLSPIGVLAVFAVILISSVSSGVAAAEPDSPSAVQFVQEFYSWYEQIYDQHDKLPPAEVALKKKPQLFSGAIINGLMEDRVAQDKSADYIVSIEFDPFINGQDTCEPYKVGKVSVVNTTYRVDVYCAGDYAQAKQPAVIAAVEKHKGEWVFVDFYYPGRGDLFSALEATKRERKKFTK